MHKDDLKVLVIIFLFAIFALVNTFFLWIPASAPPVLMVLLIATYSIWETKNGNKA
jgi:hypothetical protein